MSAADIQACLEKNFFHSLPALRTAAADAPDLLGRMKGALLRMLAETDDLPRDHLVWRYLAVQTVNPHRLSQYTHLKLQASPRDKDALWTSALMNLGSAGSVSYERWQNIRLVEEHFDASWPIYTSLLASQTDGDDEENQEALVAFLKRNDLSEGAVPVLKSLEAGEHDYARLLLEDDSYRRDDVIRWARRASELLRLPVD